MPKGEEDLREWENKGSSIILPILQNSSMLILKIFIERRYHTQYRKIITAGTISGLIMGFALFVGGAILSRIIYGPQFAPPGKFKPEKLNPFYFIWTKLLIGWFFGIFFTFIYELLPLRYKISGMIEGFKYGSVFWLIIALWSISHPLVYGPINIKDQVFWLLYQLVGYLAFGAALGRIYKKRIRTAAQVS